MTRTLFTKQP